MKSNCDQIFPSELSLNNHLKGNKIFYTSANEVSKLDYVFQIRIGRPKSTLGSPMVEALNAAQGIYEYAKTTPIWLCLSGGIDSECMAISFLKAGIDFRVAILRFLPSLNEYDYSYSVEFCRRHQINYKFFDLDLEEFYQSKDFEHLHESTRCRSPQLLTHMWLFNQIDGIPICAWNPPRIEYDGRKIKFSLPFELYFSYHRYSYQFNKPLRPFFFLETPNLFYSFLNLPVVKKIVSNPESFFNRYDFDEYLLKCHMFRAGGFSFVDRKDKYTGFESFKLVVAQKYKADEHEYTRRFRTPLEKLYPASSSNFSRLCSATVQRLFNFEEINFNHTFYSYKILDDDICFLN